MVNVTAEQINPTTPYEHAIILAGIGLRVLPIRPGGKSPPMGSWQHAATDDIAKIDNWFKGLYRDCGLGLALGDQPSGRHLFALDLDRHHPDQDGFETLSMLEVEHGYLPETWRSLTGNAGAHLIYAAPPGVTVRNQQAAGQRVGPGIDVRGQGGQIVLAPTIHPDTLNAYAWEHGYAPWEREVAVAPDWLIELVREPDTPTIAPRAATGSTTGTVFDLQRADWDWHTELSARGWTLSHNHQGDTYWVRPGKDRRAGHSAVLHGNDGPLVIFTTDIPQHWTQAGTPTRDGSGWSFGAFGFYAATEHHGNRSDAARALHTTYGIAYDDVNLGDLIDPASQPVEQTANEYDTALLEMLIDWHAFADTDHKAEAWLWEPVIPAGRATAIFAKGGTGKSLIVLRMILDIVSTGIKVLYLDYEMTSDDLDDRLSDMGVDDPRQLDGTLHYALLPALPSADTPEGGKAINRLAELVDAQLVVIDTFARAVEGDENDADTVRQFYRMTGLHLKASGRAFIRVDHAGKDATKGQRGTSAKNDDVDLVWELKRTETGYQLVRGKSRMGWVPETVKLDRSDHPLTLAVSDGTTYPIGTMDVARKLDDLEVDPNLSTRKACVVFRAAGHTGPNELIRAAQKYRQNRSSTFHFVGDLVAKPVDNSSKSAPKNPRRGPLDNEHGAPDGAVDDETVNPLADDPRRGSRRGSAHPADVGTAQCAPLIGAHAPDVTSEPSPLSFDEVF